MDKYLQVLNTNFIYKPDPSGKDLWRILDTSKIVYGDCEDYALTALYLLCGGSLIKFWKVLVTEKAKIHYVTVRGAGHAVLEFKGLYIDNTHMKWLTKDGFNKYFVPVKRVHWLEIGRQLLRGKILRAYYKIKNVFTK